MKQVYCIALLLLFVSCSEEDALPATIFPVNKMKMIVWDMEMADQTATDRFLLNKDSLRMEATSLYQGVFKKYKTNKKEFYNSFGYYEAHPVMLKVLFDSVSNYGNRQKTIYYNKSL